ncbi:S-layer homology domain-containing protein [Anaerosinus massiliensis]|uniref:S-layer homology domain-containing protein n=1 Tax=Massilibacillus massiliensis TaxID=1806837 RepID=UPI000DA61BA3|nr:S-layer homology domain-containing protein [Massilibacillus massiliensis]
MKKLFAPMMLNILVLSIAHTTYAAENPFSDVPSDHWSMHTLTILAQEGVIEGYGDGTFRGDAKLTRYEMATIIAKAMAKSNLSTNAKTQLDQLSAEYADELHNLGVRVTELEEKSDNLKINGLLRLDTSKDEVKNTTKSKARLRLEPTAFINEDWQMKARIDYDTNLKTGEGGTGTLKMAYANGNLLGGKVSVGKIDYADFENMNAAYGLIFDDYISGAKAVFGDRVKVTLVGGRIGSGSTAYTNGNGISNYPNSSLDYTGIQITGNASDKLMLGAAYHSLRDEALYKNQSIVEVAADYKLSNTLKFGGAYAKSNLDASEFNLKSDDEDQAYTVQLDYKGIKRSAPGSFGIWAAYRQLGNLAVSLPTYVANFNGEKGYEIGAKYMLDKNIMGQITYFNGETISSERDVERIFGRLEFRF